MALPASRVSDLFTFPSLSKLETWRLCHLASSCHHRSSSDCLLPHFFSLKIFYLLYVSVHACDMNVCAKMCVEVRGQLSRIGSLPPPTTPRTELKSFETLICLLNSLALYLVVPNWPDL